MKLINPLVWPDHFPRHRGARDRGRFDTPLPRALRNVETSIARFADDSDMTIADVRATTNRVTGDRNPADPGVAVWFTWGGQSLVIPVDRYDSVAANVQAIHHIVEARRTELRHGTLQLVRASFSGFAALPPPSANRPWWAILGVSEDANPGEIETAYKRKAKLHHPDAGGSVEQMAEINAARDAGMSEWERVA